MAWNSAGTFHTRLSATALTANRKFVFPDQDGTFVVASAGVVTVDRISASSIFATVLSAGSGAIGALSANTVAIGSTLTVSGAAVFGGRVQIFGTADVVSGRLTIHNANGVAVGGIALFNRALDDVSQFSLFCSGSGSITSGIVLKLDNTLAGVELFSFGLDGKFSAVGNVVVGNVLLLGRSTGSAGAYNTVGSIVATAGAAARFDNTMKAWVSFKVVAAVVTVLQSFNVASISRFGSGSYAVNYTEVVSSSAACIGTVNVTSGGIADVLVSSTTGVTFNVYTNAGVLIDPAVCSIAVLSKK